MHFHLRFLDGVYLAKGADPPVFRQVAAPCANDLQVLVEQIAADRLREPGLARKVRA